MLATVYDTMAPYDRTSAAQVPLICPKCGSHRTQVVGRSNDAKTLTLRCGQCGERSVVVIAEEAARPDRREGVS